MLPKVVFVLAVLLVSGMLAYSLWYLKQLARDVREEVEKMADLNRQLMQQVRKLGAEIERSKIYTEAMLDLANSADFKAVMALPTHIAERVEAKVSLPRVVAEVMSLSELPRYNEFRKQSIRIAMEQEAAWELDELKYLSKYFSNPTFRNKESKAEVVRILSKVAPRK